VPDDPAAQVPRAKAWTVTCTGWTGVPFGHLYTFVPSGRRSASPVGPDSPWQQTLQRRANCGSPQPANIAALPGATVRACQAIPSNVPYTVYEFTDNDVVAIAEGMSILADRLQIG
jgi:hypothetical protein